MRQVLLFLSLGLWCAWPNGLLAQQYTVNGNAVQNTCNCYTLTPAQNTQSGSVWNNIQINLLQPFDFNFDVRLGCQDLNGADGIAFILQPISTSVGTSGSGLGFGGITPSLGVTLDTYQNGGDNDPTFDHIAIQTNGILNHSITANNLAGPIQISSTSDNVEDCNWHSLRVKWDPVTKTLEAYFDGVLRVSAVKDLVADVFGGNPSVFWGFTGSTGGLNNEQQFCTALRPNIKSLAQQKRCFNEPITFLDSTISFAPIVKRYWDFGDGSPIDSVNLNPTHVYPIPGNYTVTLTVVGTDGCRATQSLPLLIGSKPLPSFRYIDSCEVNQVTFSSTSTAQFGTINQWHWDFDNGSTANTATAVTSYASGGTKTIRLAVKSLEGCLSDTLAQPVKIWTRPTVNFSFTDSVCLGTPTQFFDSTKVTLDTVRHWVWFVNGQWFGTQNLTYTFTAPGNYQVLHGASANDTINCMGMMVKTVTVLPRPVAAFRLPPVVCQSVPTSFIDSSHTIGGAAIQQWQWLTSSGQGSALQNPSFTFFNAGNDTVQLVVQNSRGCVSDTLKRVVAVNAKPVARLGVAGALCAGNPLQFTDSAMAGSVTSWDWQFSNGTGSTQQNPVQSFAAGPQTAALAVTSQAGCRSDTARLSFAVRPGPQVGFTAPDGCVGDTIRFTATANMPIDAWVWNYGDGAVGSTQTTSYVYALPGSYTASLVARDTSGCLSDTARRIIQIGGSNANAGPDVVAAAGQPVTLQAGGGVLYQWTPTTGLSNPNIANPVATPTQTTTYTVRAFTPQGCASTDAMTIVVYKGPDIYVPTAFSPNGDGRNDVFRAIPVGITRFENLSVFNRYGQIIFFTSNASFGWDGTWKGQRQPQGSYVWMVGGTDFRGQRIFKQGSVMLIR